MRSILALTVILILSFNANAQINGTRTVEMMATRGGMKAAVAKAKIALVEEPIFARPISIWSAISMLPANSPASDAGLFAVKEIDLTILYKMKANKIRRALSFTPGKKWLKWA